MPDAARFGLRRPFSSATSVNSAGMADSRSTSPLRKREPPRLALLDHRDLDARHQRQPLVLQRRDQWLRRRRYRPDRHVGDAAKARVRLEDDARAPLVLGEPVGARADGVGADVAAVGLDDLARDGAHVRHGEHVREAVVGRLEPDLQRVAVDDLETGQRRVVVEPARARRRGLGLVAADQLALDQPRPRRALHRVEVTLDAVGVVGGGQFPRHALECGIGREHDALAHAADDRCGRRPRPSAATRACAARAAPDARGSRSRASTR